MRQQQIADVIEFHLAKLNRKAGISPVTPNDYERVRRAATRHNSNLNKCSCTIGDKEFNGHEVKKIKLPNLNQPKYETMIASSDGIKGKLVLEIIY